MIFDVVIEPRAILDIQEAVDYYEAKQVGLGEYLYQIVDENIETLTKNPFFKSDAKIIMVCLLKKFPFIIFFY